MLKKLFIVPFFGPLPAWFEHYRRHVEHLKPHGYEFLFETDLAAFRQRVRTFLDLDAEIIPGTGKPWDYRPALGVLYRDVVASYDFWGHTDLDCVYGQVGKWVTNDFLDALDVHSNHNAYVCGPWTLYRNRDDVNNLFRQSPDWRTYMTEPTPNAWVETAYSRLLEQSGLRYKYTYWQNLDPRDDSAIEFSDGTLRDHRTEIMMFHFRWTKRWPL